MTERNLSPEVIALIVAGKVEPVLFLFADFPLGAKRLWTGRGTYVDADENVWEGVGGVVRIEGLEESVDTAAKGIKVTLSGLDTTLVTPVLQQPFQGRVAMLKLGFWDRNSNPMMVVETPEPWWKGVMDMDESTISGRSTDLTISCEHRMVDLLRKREIRYTHQDQQLLYPDAGDTGLQYIEVIQDKVHPWGRATT